MPIDPLSTPGQQSRPSHCPTAANVRGPGDTRRGAIGKALLVWLLSGSFGLAVVAFIIFAMIGC